MSDSQCATSYCRYSLDQSPGVDLSSRKRRQDSRFLPSNKVSLRHHAIYRRWISSYSGSVTAKSCRVGLIDCFTPGVMLPPLKCNTRTTLTILAPIGTPDKLAAESLIADAIQIMRIWIRNLLNRPGKPTTGKLSLVSSEECRPTWQLLLRHTHLRILQFGAS